MVYNTVFCDKMSWAKTNAIADLVLKRSTVRNSNENDKRIRQKRSCSGGGNGAGRRIYVYYYTG